MLGFRHRRHRTHEKALHPLAIVGICLAVAVLLTLIIGNLLKLWLNDETYRKLTEGESAPPADIPQNAAVPNINAAPFAFGEEVDSVLGQRSISVALNAPDGTLQYTSEVATYLGLPCAQEVSVLECVGELNAFGIYISGSFYPQAFGVGSSDLLHTVALQEGALLREFVHTGGSEVVLRGLPLTVTDLQSVCAYLKAIKAAAPEAVIGVAVPPQVGEAAGGWEVLATLEQYCDFYVLDLTAEEVIDSEPVADGELSPAAQALLLDCDYYISQYAMRVMAREDQSALVTVLEWKMYPNYQVVKAS